MDTEYGPWTNVIKNIVFVQIIDVHVYTCMRATVKNATSNPATQQPPNIIRPIHHGRLLLPTRRAPIAQRALCLKLTNTASTSEHTRTRAHAECSNPKKQFVHTAARPSCEESTVRKAHPSNKQTKKITKIKKKAFFFLSNSTRNICYLCFAKRQRLYSVVLTIWRYSVCSWGDRG